MCMRKMTQWRMSSGWVCLDSALLDLEFTTIPCQLSSIMTQSLQHGLLRKLKTDAAQFPCTHSTATNTLRTDGFCTCASTRSGFGRTRTNTCAERCNSEHLSACSGLLLGNPFKPTSLHLLSAQARCFPPSKKFPHVLPTLVFRANVCHAARRRPCSTQTRRLPGHGVVSRVKACADAEFLASDQLPSPSPSPVHPSPSWTLPSSDGRWNGIWCCAICFHWWQNMTCGGAGVNQDAEPCSSIGEILVTV